MPKYKYVGPVLIFGKCVDDRWRAETIAPSKKKALSNFAYQFKEKNDMMANAKIELVGKVTEVN